MILNAVAQDILDTIGDKEMSSMVFITSFGKGEGGQFLFGRTRDLQCIVNEMVEEVPMFRALVSNALGKYIIEHGSEN